MRRSLVDTDFITADDKKIIGISLGYDHCAEHEWGIKQLKNRFGITNEELGYEGSKNKIVPKNLFYVNNKNPSIFAPNYIHDKKDLTQMINRELNFYSKKQEVVAAWGENDFGVRVKNKYKKDLENLYDAFQTKNGIIVLSGRSNPFANSGLILLDYRLIPEEIKEKSRVEDKKARKYYQKCKTAEEKSGVLKALEKSGKKFYSLSVRQFNKKGEPQWWLNPQEQHLYESGWYSNKDLKDWANNKGRIIKKK